jgi:hypothetical protein
MLRNKHKLLTIVFGLILTFIFLPTQVFAVTADSSKPLCFGGENTNPPVECPTGRGLQAGKCYTVASGPTTEGAGIYTEMACEQISTTQLEQPKFVKNDCNGPNIRAFAPEGDENHCGILDYLMVFINVLSGIVGVVVIAMIIIGGIQYSAAQDNPNAISAAKKRITNAVLALLVFIFMFTFLQWLVPGGLF